MRMASKLASVRERGDTMVEVLIAIAVVSLILGGAYVTTNRSLQATRAAQERSTALKLAESQIERLKGLVESDATSDLVFGPAAPDPFCISGVSNQPQIESHDDCTVNNSGAPTEDEPKYHISIDRTGNTFVLTTTWANVSGQVDDQLQLRYRVYE